MYQVIRPSRSDFLPIRDQQYHLRVWGAPDPDVAPLVLVHGWMDVAASWQFMVDAMAAGRWIIAPDWRGFGLSRSEGPAVDSYWFPDYLADLDALLDHLVPDRAVDLVGHSMGGNVAMVYAGIRPARVRRLVNLEGFGMPATRPAQAPGRYGQWLDEIRALRQGQTTLKDYDDVEAVARRLMKTNPRLDRDKAEWLAQHWARPDAQGRWRILGDPAHKVVSAQLYRVDEVLEIFRRITAPTLSITASDDSLGLWWRGKYTLAEYRERIRTVPRLSEAEVRDAGHMLHHDQPQALAGLVENFLTA
ncbi:MAG TPA: alpha/beta hydrolase [Hydrogenophaga sp.]|uniref:alpha/beta fold hydrolase n=1 Tax=Hydrogenophaga sp. TaxID=1904254 RepID=UPI002C50CC90|nr:alpha/beta hydrolase [Hydrogenophaga sp.]HMN93533.1 alpha/beta hydrolase [Hydrogenophaga sp.]HMP10248.1 alpha/beta hydrolase [Hydrogenophaga sp.]